MGTIVYIVAAAAFYLLGYFRRDAMSGVSDHATVSDETDAYPIEGKSCCVHEMECRACGHAYEHVYGDYEFCPRCGRRLAHKTEESDV